MLTQDQILTTSLEEVDVSDNLETEDGEDVAHLEGSRLTQQDAPKSHVYSDIQNSRNNSSYTHTAEKEMKMPTWQINMKLSRLKYSQSNGLINNHGGRKWSDWACQQKQEADQDWPVVEDVLSGKGSSEGDDLG